MARHFVRFHTSQNCLQKLSVDDISMQQAKGGGVKNYIAFTLHIIHGW